MKIAIVHDWLKTITEIKIFKVIKQNLKRKKGDIMKERGNIVFRYLDRYIGIPSLLFIALIRKVIKRKQLNDISLDKINKICAIKISGIGDTLLLMPVLKELKEKYPNSILTVICAKNNHEVITKYSFIDELKIFDVSRVIKNPFYFLKFIKDVNSEEYDLLIDFEQWCRITALLTAFIKAKYRFGFNTLNQHRHYIYDYAVPHNPYNHEIENFFALIKHIGVENKNLNVYNQLGFPISERDRKIVHSNIEEMKIQKHKFIIFHPWSSGYKGYNKEWDIEKFKTLAHILTSEGYYVIITGTRQNNEKAQKIVNVCPSKIFTVCGKLSLSQTAYLIKNSLLLITVNTGIMHLGAILNHPMIVLEGPAGLIRWGPISNKSYIIKSNLPCVPCLNLGFEYKCKKFGVSEGKCMKEIKVEDVIKAVYKMINIYYPNLRPLQNCLMGVTNWIL